MMTFVNMRNEGLLILPTHRLIANVHDFRFDKLLEAVGADFQITKFEFTNNGQKAAARHKMFDKMNEDFKKNKNAFGIYAANDAFYVLSLKDLQAVDQACPNLSKASNAPLKRVVIAGFPATSPSRMKREHGS